MRARVFFKNNFNVHTRNVKCFLSIFRCSINYHPALLLCFLNFYPSARIETRKNIKTSAIFCTPIFTVLSVVASLRVAERDQSGLSLIFCFLTPSFSVVVCLFRFEKKRSPFTLIVKGFACDISLLRSLIRYRFFGEEDRMKKSTTW